MEELQTLRICIEQQRYADALNLISEMEEMSKEDKINKVGSFINVLLIHLIKRYAEQRTTPSWDASIGFALFQIERTNKRRKAGGWYMTHEQIRSTIAEYYPYALTQAALEAFGGRYHADELATKFDAEAVREEAYRLIVER